jgi:hypothetical protein
MRIEPQEFTLTVRIEISKSLKGGGYTGERLTIDETVVLKPGTFLEATTILGRFHELAERVKADSGKDA